MAIGTPVSIGTVQNKTSETTTALTTTAAVPAGALIVVCYAVDGDGAERVDEPAGGRQLKQRIAGQVSQVPREAQAHQHRVEKALMIGDEQRSSPTGHAAAAEDADAEQEHGQKLRQRLEEGVPEPEQSGGQGVRSLHAQV